RDPVGIALLLEAARERDLLRDVIGRAAEHLRGKAAHALAVAQPLVGVAPRDLGGALAALARGALELVLARVGVVREVADVGHVDHVGDPPALGEERSLEQVREELRAQVAEVLRRVDGGATGVEARVARLHRLEGPLAARARVVEDEPAHRAPSCAGTSSATACAAMPSPRPIAPRPSVLVAFTFTRAASVPSA